MSNKKGLLALSPLFLLIVLIVAFTVYSVDSSHQDTSLSLTVAFMISSIYAVAISGGMPVRKRVDTYSKGAGANNLMLMLWIYVLAGSFAASAKAMGAVDATVNLALSILPANMILPQKQDQGPAIHHRFPIDVKCRYSSASTERLSLRYLPEAERRIWHLGMS